MKGSLLNEGRKCVAQNFFDCSNVHEDEGSSDAATQKRNRKRRLAASKGK